MESLIILMLLAVESGSVSSVGVGCWNLSLTTLLNVGMLLRLACLLGCILLNGIFLCLLRLLLSIFGLCSIVGESQCLLGFRLARLSEQLNRRKEFV